MKRTRQLSIFSALAILARPIGIRGDASFRPDQRMQLDSWGAPQQAAADRRARVMRYPSVAVRAGRRVIAGYSIRQFDGSRMPANPLIMFDSQLGVLPLPAGDWTFSLARIAFSPDGLLVLLWGEPATRDAAISVDNWPPKTTSLWQSIFTSDRHWTAPTELLTARSIDWQREYGDLGGVSRDSRPSIVVDVRRGRGLEFALLTLDDGGWRMRAIPRSLEQAYPLGIASIASSSSATIAVLGEASRGDPTPVIVVVDAPKRYGIDVPEKLVSRSTVGVRQSSVRLASGPDNSITLAWVERSIQGVRLRAMRRSRNASASWDSLPSLPLMFEPTGVHLTVDGRGRQHVVFGTDLNSGSLELSHFVFDGQWREIDLLRGSGGSDTFLTRTSLGSLLLVFTIRRGGNVETQLTEFSPP